jgi:hypothetical protein
MNRAGLTALYLDELKRHGIAARELIGTESVLLDSFHGGRYLARPMFLGQDEREQLESDLANLRAALLSLPDKLYGGDLPAFARSVGMTEVQVSAIMRSRAAAPTTLARADLYVDHAGFRLLEYNMGSPLGGIDNADLVRALLQHPVLADFARAHRLGYADSSREQVRTILAECGFAPGSRPVMVMTDWPSSYEKLAPSLRLYSARLCELGLDARAAHLGELRVRDGRVWLGEVPVDIIYRLFMIEDLLEYPEAPALLDPILDAAARGEVAIFTPLDDALFASKGALAMLSDETNRPLFDQRQLASLDRILPWTRMARPGLVTLEDGSRVELLDYALSHQQDLALKPTLLHGGQGVLLGWHRDTAAEAWAEQVRGAMDGPYVIQRRIRPVREEFPTDAGDTAPWIVVWGVFTMLGGYSGVYARGTSVESNIEVVNLGTGAFATSCLDARPVAG